MEINRTLALKAFQRYVAGFQGVSTAVGLKYNHSLKVSRLCEALARSLHFSAEDVDLAWLIGLLHDIGRFEQLRKFHTFI